MSPLRSATAVQIFVVRARCCRMVLRDKGEMRISRINRIQLAIILAIRVKHCAPLFPIRVNPCPSVVKILLRKERCHEIAPQRQLSFGIDYNEDNQNPKTKNDGNSQPRFFPVSSMPWMFFPPALHRLIGWLISSNHVSAICHLDVCRKNRHGFGSRVLRKASMKNRFWILLKSGNG